MNCVITVLLNVFFFILLVVTYGITSFMHAEFTLNAFQYFNKIALSNKI